MSLGTDGAGSNNALNMFMEMNAAALVQKVRRDDPTVMGAQRGPGRGDPGPARGRWAGPNWELSCPAERRT